LWVGPGTSRTPIMSAPRSIRLVSGCPFRVAGWFDGHESEEHLPNARASKRDVALAAEGAGQCGEEVRECLSTIALAWCKHGASRTKSSATTVRRESPAPNAFVTSYALSRRIPGRIYPWRERQKVSPMGT
jgi:hypothetical protein